MIQGGDFVKGDGQFWDLDQARYFLVEVGKNLSMVGDHLYFVFCLVHRA